MHPSPSAGKHWEKHKGSVPTRISPSLPLTKILNSCDDHICDVGGSNPEPDPLPRPPSYFQSRVMNEDFFALLYGSLHLVKTNVNKKNSVGRYGHIPEYIHVCKRVVSIGMYASMSVPVDTTVVAGMTKNGCDV